ncbi:hypothetical protein [Halostreptopolyspora alba]|uniref:Uncharacterized protein n=1 Tax=Halostreptopolyspora alba TaxID=2487137 RepID=A0A3N0EA95_9ACTN|nr:hypothetical protein EFW17_10720 [Nocardiopsaceae bacterium YIM 96095]
MTALAAHLLGWLWGDQSGWARLVWPAPIDLCPVARTAEPLGTCRYYRWPEQASALLADALREPSTRFDPQLCKAPPPTPDEATLRDLLPDDFDSMVSDCDLPAPDTEPEHLPSTVVWVEADRLDADRWRLVEALDAVVTAPEDGWPLQVWASAGAWANFDTAPLAGTIDRGDLVVEDPPHMWWPAQLVRAPSGGAALA